MKYIIDLLFILGLLLIIVPVFLLHFYAGCFLLGAIFVVISVYFGKREVSE